MKAGRYVVVCVCSSYNLVLKMLTEPTLVFVAFLTLINVCASKTSVGSFITRSHDVRGEVYFTDDDTTLEIKDFYYDGKYTVSF